MSTILCIVFGHSWDKTIGQVYPKAAPGAICKRCGTPYDSKRPVPEGMHRS